MRFLARLIVPVAAALLAAACGGPVSGSGAAPSIGAPAVPTTPAVTAAPATTAPPGAAGVPGTPSPSEPASLPASAPPASAPPFTLTSGAFTPGGSIPKRFTCDGVDVSPALAWSGAPASTGALVLVVDDPDAAGFVHWIAYNLDAAAGAGVPEDVGTGKEAPPQGTNDFGKPGWGGPCPPSGEHHYRFTLDALTGPLPLTGAPGAASVRDALAKATILATTTLEGRYARP